MTLYNVHLYATVRVKLLNVEATDHAEAMQKAEDRTDLNGIFNREPFTTSYSNFDIGEIEYAGEVTSYLVDEVGDEEHERSRDYGPDHQSLRPAGDDEGIASLVQRQLMAGPKMLAALKALREWAATMGGWEAAAWTQADAAIAEAEAAGVKVLP